MHTERDFENDIEAELLKSSSCHTGDPAGYDAERAMFVPVNMHDQPKIWDYPQNLHKDDAGGADR